MTFDTPRTGDGKFARLVCVNAHDRCFMGGPCSYCEPASKDVKIGETPPRFIPAVTGSYGSPEGVQTVSLNRELD